MDKQAKKKGVGVPTKKLKRGRDYHGWAWKHIRRDDDDPLPNGLFYWACAHKPRGERPTESGRWVRVKFIEVKP